MVNLVFVQAYSLGQVDLNFVGSGQTTDEIAPPHPELLSNGNQRRDVVAGVGVLGGQKCVVEVEFANRDAVGPCRPFGRISAVHTEDRRPLSRAVGGGLWRATGAG